MSSRKRNAPHANRVQRRGTNLNDVIIISDDESEDGVVADSPKYNPVTPRRRSKRPILSDTQNSNIRGCWPVKKRKSVLQGQSSNSTNHLHDSTSTKNSMDHCRHIFFNNFAQPPAHAIQEPMYLSQYRLETPYNKSILPDLNQCGLCWQKIPEGHPNYIPLMSPLTVDSSSDDDYEEALHSYETIENIDPQQWKDWFKNSFNTPPHKR